jgi:hypothetical protein
MYAQKNIHVENIVVVVVVIVCGKVFLVGINTDPKSVLQVDAKRNGDVDPATFMATCLCESSGRNNDEM